ncbi:MAG: PAS domain-containing protein, partial [Bacteroidota bacterium]
MHQKLAEKIEKLDVEPALRNKLKDLISIMDDSTDGSSDNKNQILAKANIATFDTLRKQLPFEVHLDKNFNVSWANKGFIKIIDPYYEKMESERLGNFTSSGKKDLISKEFEELPVHSLFLLPEPLQLNLSSLHEITFNSVWFLKTPEGYRLVFKKQEDTPLFNQWTISPDNTRFIICEIDIHGTLKRCNSTFNLKFGLDQGMGESTHLKEWLNPLYIHRFETILSRVIYENESASLNICFKDDDPESSNAYSCTLIPDVEARRVMFIAFHSHLTERDDEKLYMDEHLYRSL